MTEDSSNSEFVCLRCGHCCEGSGGIVVSNADLERLCAHFGLEAGAFAERYAQRRGGKLQVRAGADGWCLFFVPGHGCGVHEARPDICRAWPYFRGNLSDSGSFAMAKDFCPGIPKNQTYADFVREGLTSLAGAGICGRGGPDEAAALQVDDIQAPDESVIFQDESVIFQDEASILKDDTVISKDEAAALKGEGRQRSAEAAVGVGK